MSQTPSPPRHTKRRRIHDPISSSSPEPQLVAPKPLIHIPKLDSDAWGPPDVATARASLEPSVTTENEALVRTHHRSLARCKGVWVYEEDDTTRLWVVEPGGLDVVADTHAAGREIHFHPGAVYPRTIHEATIGPFRHDPITQSLNPHELLSSDIISELQIMCPLSVGARVFFCGFLAILFQSRDDIKKTWKHDGQAATFGNLRVVYDVMASRPSSELIHSGKAIAPHPNDSNVSASFGLKLRFPNGQLSITVPTHAFVKLRHPSRPLLGVLDWVTRIKSRMLRFRPTKQTSHEPAVSVSKDADGNSPVGKLVYLAGQARAIGRITSTYDPPIPRNMPFPCGFLHDLSLVTSDNLPTVTSPPGAPRIVGWGGYDEVLNGAPVFIVCSNVVTGNQIKRTGSGVSRSAQRALAIGSEYSWDRRALSSSASILWRTGYDGDRLKGFSGSVLCLGQLQADTCRAVCFQNFEAPLSSEELLHHDHRKPPPGSASHPTVKGGFLLPEDIRQTDILSEGFESTAAPGTFPSRGRNSKELRRSFSSHG